MCGKIIVIDGADGVGKTTQTQLLYEKLKAQINKVILVSFPNYKSASSSLVKMYLSGDISQNMNCVNAYGASSFYAMDRYISYKKEWEQYYNDGYVILANRYVSSNLIHQMTRIPKKEWEQFKNWLYDYEFEKLLLPRPTKTIYLNMSREIAEKLIDKRCCDNNIKRDLHEQNKEYLKKCAEFSLQIGKSENWSIIDCFSGDTILDINTINNKILDIVKEVI